MLRKLALVFLIALAALSLSGCVDYTTLLGDTVDATPAPEATPLPPLTEEIFTDYKAFTARYRETTFSDTLETLTARYGEPEIGSTEGGKFYSFRADDNTGVSVVFFENGHLRAKVVEYDDIRQLINMAPGKNLDSASNLTKDYDYATVSGVFGSKGLEITRIASDSSVNPSFSRVMLWMTETASVQVLFDENGKVSQVNYGDLTGGAAAQSTSEPGTSEGVAD